MVVDVAGAAIAQAPIKSPVGQRLEILMEQTRRPDGQRWTAGALADALKARGQDVSRQYLGAIITGERDEPRISLVEALADVFNVPVVYFTNDWLGAAFVQALPVILAMRDPNVAALLRRPDLPQIAEALANPDESEVEAKLSAMIAQVLARQAAGGTPQA
jgi:transcriptional regulator with XRE-family HTH domain